MVMDRMMEFKKESNNKKLLPIVEMVISNINNVLSFCKRSSKVTYFKISFSYEIQTHNSGAVLYDKTWEEGKK